MLYAKVAGHVQDAFLSRSITFDGVGVVTVTLVVEFKYLAFHLVVQNRATKLDAILLLADTLKQTRQSEPDEDRQQLLPELGVDQTLDVHRCIVSVYSILSTSSFRRTPEYYLHLLSGYL